MREKGKEGGREDHMKGMPSKDFRLGKRTELPCMDCSLP